MKTLDILVQLDSMSKIYDNPVKCATRDAAIEIRKLRAAIKKTLDDNGHLADGDNCTLINLKRAIDYDETMGVGTGSSDRCNRCGGEMRPGQAIAQTFAGSPDLGGEVCTMSQGGTGKLIECSKCTSYGWSVSVGHKEVAA